MSAHRPVEVLEWDTAHFGLRIGRVTPHSLQDGGVDLRSWVQTERIACAYLLVGAEEFAHRRAAEIAGFRVVDVRLSLSLSLEHRPELAHELPVPAALPASALIRPALEHDREALRQIARTSHRNTRFFSDQRFDPERSEALYASWLDRSLDDAHTQVFTAVTGSDVAGYVTVRCEPDSTGSIGLIAVAHGSRGAGIGRELLGAAISWLRDHKSASVTVVTQGGSVAAQRIYQSLGFRTQEVSYWMHAWFGNQGD